MALIPTGTIPTGLDVGMNTQVLLFTLAASVSSGLLFGLFLFKPWFRHRFHHASRQQ